MKPCWLLTTPRTGSTFLCNVLNNTKRFDPLFLEYFHERNIRRELCPKFAKVHAVQLPKGLIPENFYPDIKYIVLNRRDIYRQVVSDYFAQKTQCWSVTSDKAFTGDFGYMAIPREEYLKRSVEWDRTFIVHLYNDFQKYRTAWDVFLKERSFLTVDYDDLVQNPKKEIERILNYLEEFVPSECVDRAICECKFVPVNHPLYGTFIEKLKLEVS